MWFKTFVMKRPADEASLSDDVLAWAAEGARAALALKAKKDAEEKAKKICIKTKNA